MSTDEAAEKPALKPAVVKLWTIAFLALLVPGQNQAAFVEPLAAEIRETVKVLDGTVVETLLVPARR